MSTLPADWQVPKGWTMRAAGDVATLQRGFDLPVQDRLEGPVPIYAANGAVGTHSTHKVKGPGVVTGRSGSLGNVHFVEGNFWPLNTALWVKDFHGNDPKWVSRLLHWMRLEQYTRGVGVPTLNRNLVHEVEVPVPPLTEQKRIAAILDQADELRRKRQDSLDRLNQLGQAIFIEMFGDLGDGGLASEPLGLLTAKIGSGATPKGGDSTYKAEGIPLIRSMNVRDGHFSEKGLAFIDKEQATKLANVIVKHNDVLLNITGASVARVCTVPAEMEGARVNQHVSIIRPTEQLLSVLIEAYLLLPIIKKKLLSIAESGATRQAITKAQIEQLPIPLPPIGMQQEFALRAGVVHRVQETASMHYSRLEGLFASLQYRAFRGELTASSLSEATA